MPAWEIRLYDGSCLVVNVDTKKDLAKELVKYRGAFWTPVPEVTIRHAMVISVRPVAHVKAEAKLTANKKKRVIVRGFE
jgi:hypothetical protein